MDIKKIAKAAEDQGWTVERTNKGHWRFTPPVGTICFFSGTPGDRRAIRNFLSQLRRQNFIWPWPGR